MEKLTAKQRDPSLLRAYRKRTSASDEVCLPGSQPLWPKLFDQLQRLGLTVLRERHAAMERQLQQNGVTYNVYGGVPGQQERPWQVDPLPFVVDAGSWRTLEAGLAQRAQLLDWVLQDLYGPMRLLKEGIVPAELIFRHRGYLRACHGLMLKGACQLVLHGADMARGPEGRFWVLSDRTTAPSGMGYALENRNVAATMMPELFEGVHVQPLAPFFERFQRVVEGLVPRPKDNPFIVYLTPGPFNETYFEHAYLAAYLGYTLVQGSDLVMRDGFVWLKCIDGLQKVDVIVRRVDDVFCDPLELREDSVLGVAGLLEAMRQGNVAVVNPPGSAVLENRGLFAFLPQIARFFLGEDLRLQTMPTWWCGTPDGLRYVEAHLEQLVIKKINRSDNFKRVYGRQLDAEGKKALLLQLRKTPWDFVGHEEIGFSTTPALTESGIMPRMAAVRAYTLGGADGYASMMGGLTRTSALADSFSVSNRYGGIAKDTWVVEDQMPLVRNRLDTMQLPSTQRLSMPSRSAENLFWVGRMTERSIATSHFLEMVMEALGEHQRGGGGMEGSPMRLLLMALTNLTITYPGFVGKGAQQLFKTPAKELLDLAGNAQRVGSVPYDLQALRYATAGIRELISLASWKAVDLLGEGQQQLEQAVAEGKPLFVVQQALQKVNTQLFTFYGTMSETMPRHEGRVLYKTGKLLERSLASIAVMRTVLGFAQEGAGQQVLFDKLLGYHHSLTYYRQRYKSHINFETVADTLLYSVQLPHSLSTNLNKLELYLKALPTVGSPGRLNEAQRLLLSATAKLKLSSPEALAEAEDTGFRRAFDTLLSEITQHLLDLSVALTNLYFNHTPAQHALAGGV